MGIFNSKEFIPTGIKNLSGIENEIKNHFAGKDFTVKTEETVQGCFISLTKGGIFKSVLGMKSSLNVDIQIQDKGISVEAKVGIFGQQVIPGLIAWFVAWPVLVTQVIGLVNQSKLDDEILQVIKDEIKKEESTKSLPDKNENKTSSLCIKCGKEIPEDADFCPFCGEKQE